MKPEDLPSISVYALETEEYREALRAVDVVMGKDVNTQHMFVVFGRQALKDCAAGVTEDLPTVLVVEVDQPTDELEYLLAAVQVLKGYDEYEAYEHKGPLVWHYTTRERLHQILASGVIRPATAFVPKDERPVVWFTKSPQWEQTANKWFMNDAGEMVSGDIEMTRELGGGLARIGIDPKNAPHDWSAFKRLSGIKSRMAKSLYNTAIRQGSKPSDWRVSFDPIPRSQWLTIETLEGDLWEHYYHQVVQA